MYTILKKLYFERHKLINYMETGTEASLCWPFVMASPQHSFGWDRPSLPGVYQKCSGWKLHRSFYPSAALHAHTETKKLILKPKALIIIDLWSQSESGHSDTSPSLTVWSVLWGGWVTDVPSNNTANKATEHLFTLDLQGEIFATADWPDRDNKDLIFTLCIVKYSTLDCLWMFYCIICSVWLWSLRWSEVKWKHV